MSDLPPITGNGNEATVTLLDHLDAIRAGDIALQQERDRRYAEVSIEREKALKIKEVADLAALQLAREIQTYKDEKANELREQISRERGTYVTKDELQGVLREIHASIKPLTEFVASMQGRSTGAADSRLNLSVLVQVLAFAAVVVALVLTRH
jgi:hypothetical protein